jgi:virginiamycin A acetyltransferase
MNGMFHILDAFSTYPFMIFLDKCKAEYSDDAKPPFKGDIVIGNDVWIGRDATFLPGVKISDGAIIGTNSLITKDVGPYEVWGGNPAKLIRRRFTGDVIELLLKIRWWNWEIEKIRENIDVLASGDVEKLKKLLDKINH